VTPFKGGDMFGDEHAVAPVGQSFHPEFGYLCPAAGLRRRVRQVAKLVLVAITVVGGAAFGLSSALWAPPAGKAARVAPAVAQAPTGQKAGASAAGTAAAGVATQAIAAPAVPTILEIKTFASMTVEPAVAPSTQRTATVSGEAALAHAQAACDDLSLSFLSSQCRPGRKSHSAHSPATGRLATVPLGRVDAPPAADPHKAAEPAPAEKPAKKPAKTAQGHAPIRDNARADTAVAVSASPPASGLFGFLRDLPRLADGPFGQFLR
jgi:hypothetical protein